MKRIFGVFLILSFIMIMVGCKGSTNTEAYEKAAKEFITLVYTFEDTDKILDQNDMNSVMKKAFDSLVNLKQNFAWLPVLDTILAGFNNKSKISVKNIDLSYYNKISDTGAMVYTYTADIVSTPLKEGGLKEFKLSGQIQVAKNENTYKVTVLAPNDVQSWFEFSRGR